MGKNSLLFFLTFVIMIIGQWPWRPSIRGCELDMDMFWSVWRDRVIIWCAFKKNESTHLGIHIFLIKIKRLLYLLWEMGATCKMYTNKCWVCRSWPKLPNWFKENFVMFGGDWFVCKCASMKWVNELGACIENREYSDVWTHNNVSTQTQTVEWSTMQLR